MGGLEVTSLLMSCGGKCLELGGRRWVLASCVASTNVDEMLVVPFCGFAWRRRPFGGSFGLVAASSSRGPHDSFRCLFDCSRAVVDKLEETPDVKAWFPFLNCTTLSSSLACLLRIRALLLFASLFCQFGFFFLDGGRGLGEPFSSMRSRSNCAKAARLGTAALFGT